MYPQFNIYQFYVLPTHFISLYNTNWLAVVFYELKYKSIFTNSVRPSIPLCNPVNALNILLYFHATGYEAVQAALPAQPSFHENMFSDCFTLFNGVNIYVFRFLWNLV
jgi:hypothetical protein